MQSRMENLETDETLGTITEGRQKKAQQMSYTDPTNKSGVNTYFREEQAVALSYKTYTVCSKVEYLPVANEMEEYMGDFSL